MDWQPIETAPKDGSVIRIRGAAGPYGITEWTGTAVWATPVNRHRDSSTWLVPHPKRKEFGATLSLAGYVPTHWMPLPPPPDK